MASGERPGSLPVPAQASAPRWRCRLWRCRTSTQSRISERPAKARTLFTATSQKFKRQPKSGSGSTGKKRNALSKTHSILVCFLRVEPARGKTCHAVGPFRRPQNRMPSVSRCRDRRTGPGFRWYRERHPHPWNAWEAGVLVKDGRPGNIAVGIPIRRQQPHYLLLVSA